jgi:hypothetical protein
LLIVVFLPTKKEAELEEQLAEMQQHLAAVTLANTGVLADGSPNPR